MDEGKNNVQMEFAKFISNLRYADLPSDIVKEAKYRILDWLGSALAGVQERPSQIITGMVNRMGGAAQATVIKGGKKVPVGQAALANGIIGHAVEFDDGHKQAIAHPGAISVPTSIAVSEYVSGSGKDLLTAVVAGYEVLISLGMAVNPSHYRIWHATGTCGTFAAAAVAANLMKLGEDKTRMALGIAGTMASGLQETFGTHAKTLNVGHACQSGIMAALLAEEGFTGPQDIILGSKGFVNATSCNADISCLSRLNGTCIEGKYLINTAFYKMYASCGHTHSPLDAVFMLMKKYSIPVESIRKIRILTYRASVELTGQFKNNSPEQAKFSLPYCVAVAILRQKVTHDEFTCEMLNDPLVAHVAQKIEVMEDQEMSRGFPKDRRAIVTVELINNQILEQSVNTSKSNPSDKVLEEKFMSLSEKCVGRESALKIMDTVLNLEKASDLQDLIKTII